MADDVMKITLDYPPSANVYWRMANNRLYLSEAANDFKAMTMYLCASAGFEPLEGDVSVRLKFFRPRKSGDLDNRIKVCLDALQGYAYVDDSQVVEIHATRHDDKDCPRVEVEVTQVQE